MKDFEFYLEKVQTEKEAKQKKIAMVMKEFKEGKLKSGSGDKVTDPKQALAIAYSYFKKKPKK